MSFFLCVIGCQRKISLLHMKRVVLLLCTNSSRTASWVHALTNERSKAWWVLSSSNTQYWFNELCQYCLENPESKRSIKTSKVGSWIKKFLISKFWSGSSFFQFYINKSLLNRLPIFSWYIVIKVLNECQDSLRRHWPIGSSSSCIQTQSREKDYFIFIKNSPQRKK